MLSFLVKMLCSHFVHNADTNTRHVAASKIRKVQVYRKYYYDGYSLNETFLESYFRRRKSNLDSTLNR